MSRLLMKKKFYYIDDICTESDPLMSVFIKKLIPLSFKSNAKYILSGDAHRDYLHYSKICRLQNKAIREYPPGAARLIVFLIPGAEPKTRQNQMSGGIMSMVSLFEETVRLKDLHKSEVIMCTLNKHLPLFRLTRFENQAKVFRFDQLRRYFCELKDVLFHIPEFACEHLLVSLSKGGWNWLRSLPQVHINILNQNIKLMPSPEITSRLRQNCHQLTITTAHKRYCDSYHRKLYDVPLHEFSVWISPENYKFKKYHDKQNLMIISPDTHPLKQEIMRRLSEIPGLELVVINGVTYEQYKEIISKAKWALTFGEGLDGYFVESIFSGAIGFTVYNRSFFTDDFERLATAYENYDAMLNQIVDDINSLDEPAKFDAYQEMQYNLCSRYYDYTLYRKNIFSFYQGDYSLP